jgi:GrpB-like predicted nucleotidyltransferase (UPF0157 family)
MIRIVPYDSRWPDCFASEANHLRTAMGSLSLRIEHVGSTSVPGLAAKPVIDIQISVATLDGLDVYVAPLASLGYRHVPFGDVDLVYPFFRKPAEWPSTHHIHLCASGSEHERRHLAFRDYLRNHPQVANEYVALKRSLAATYVGATAESREQYSLAKTEFVTSVLQRALSGHAASSDRS